MITHWLQMTIAYLHHNPNGAGLIAFAIAFAEALAIVGTIVPGSVTMTAIGALIGSKIIPAASTIIWAIFGAITGDFISYMIGRYYKKRIHKIWPFTRYPHWLEKGEVFFKKHGGKSIILGRFFGPARSMVPLVAGTFNVGFVRFLLAAIPSASLWAVMYLTPGILLGAISLELPPKLALHFISGALLIIFFIILGTWAIRFLIRKFAKTFNLEAKKIWHYLQKHHSTHWITSLLTDPQHPENHRQLISSFYAIIAGFLFLLLLWGVYHHSLITALNFPIYNLLRSLRNDYVDSVMVVITMLGDKTLVLFSGLLFIWMLVKRYWRTAWHWLLLLITTVGLEHFIKHLIFSPRPGNLLNGPIDSSFPSGHTLCSFTFFGFLAVIIGQQLNLQKKKRIYFAAISLSALIAISRLFLGAHWLTDVLGGILLASTLVLGFSISYRRGNMPYLRVKEFIITALIFLLVSWSFFAIYDFKKYKYNYSVYWAEQTIGYAAWQKNPQKFLPLARAGRLGEPVEALNIEWLGDLDTVKAALLAQGWKQHASGSNVVSMLKRLATSNTNHRISLITDLYHDRSPTLLMTKDLKNKQGAIILKLWDSDTKIRGTDQPLWIGTVSYYYLPSKLDLLRKQYKTRKVFLGATKQFIYYLEDFSWHQYNYEIGQQPVNIAKLYWDGSVLLITDQI
jgi:membrane protein DedA with SNARE-associated domain/membrane-associated phospholipid phosphatase